MIPSTGGNCTFLLRKNRLFVTVLSRLKGVVMTVKKKVLINAKRKAKADAGTVKSIKRKLSHAELQAQNTKMQAQNAEQQVQIAELQVQIAELQAQNAEREAQNAELQTQNARLQAQSAELRGGDHNAIRKANADVGKTGRLYSFRAMETSPFDREIILHGLLDLDGLRLFGVENLALMSGGIHLHGFAVHPPHDNFWGFRDIGRIRRNGVGSPRNTIAILEESDGILAILDGPPSDHVLAVANDHAEFDRVAGIGVGHRPAHFDVLAATECHKAHQKAVPHNTS